MSDGAPTHGFHPERGRLALRWQANCAIRCEVAKHRLSILHMKQLWPREGKWFHLCHKAEMTSSSPSNGTFLCRPFCSFLCGCKDEREQWASQIRLLPFLTGSQGIYCRAYGFSRSFDIYLLRVYRMSGIVPGHSSAASVKQPGFISS